MMRSGIYPLVNCLKFIRCRVYHFTGWIPLTTILCGLALSVTVSLQYWKNAISVEYLKNFPAQHLLLTHKLTDLDMMEFDGNKYMYLHQPQNVLNNFKFIIFVVSSPQNVQKRELIRKTWGNVSAYNRSMPSAVIFSVGRNEVMDLGPEIIQYRDMLQLDILDTYENLTLKGVLTLKWINQHLPTVEYIYKTDDDILLNIPLWMKILENIHQINCSCFIVGHVWQNSLVQRTGKYKVTEEDYPDEVYPAFCSGSGYLLSRNAISTILVAAQKVPLLNREDPFITGILPALTDIPLFAINKTFYKLYPNELDISHIFQCEILVVHRAIEEQWMNASKPACTELGSGRPGLNITLTHAPAWRPQITGGKNFLKMKKMLAMERSSPCEGHVPVEITLHV